MGEAFEECQACALNLEVLRARRILLEERIQVPLAFGPQRHADPLDQALLVLPHGLENQLSECPATGDLDLVNGQKGDRLLEEDLGPDQGTDQGTEMRGHALMSLFIEGAVAEVLQDEPPMPSGRGFVVGRQIHGVGRNLQPVGDVVRIVGMVGAAEEPVRGPEVSQLQEKTDLIRRRAQGGDQFAQGR